MPKDSSAGSVAHAIFFSVPASVSLFMTIFNIEKKKQDELSFLYACIDFPDLSRVYLYCVHNRLYFKSALSLPVLVFVDMMQGSNHCSLSRVLLPG